MKTFTVPAVVAASFAIAAPANASIAEWAIGPANAGVSDTVANSLVAANASASDLVATGITGPFNNAATFCYLDWSTGAVDDSQYYEFTVQAAAGFALDFDSIELSVASGGSGNSNYQIAASTDGFSSSTVVVTETFVNNATFQRFTSDISSLGTLTGPVSFRFTIYNNSASGFAGLGGVGTTFSGDVGPLIINGSVVPTPASAALLGMAGVVATRRRR